MESDDMLHMQLNYPYFPDPTKTLWDKLKHLEYT